MSSLCPCPAPDSRRSGRTSRRATGKGFWAALLAIAIMLLAGSQAQAAPTPAPAADAPHVTFGVQPGARNGPDTSRSNFSYSATAGARMSDYIAFRNYANEPVTLQIYAADAFNGPTGAYDVLRRTTKSKDLGAWIKLGRSSVKIPGRAFVIVPFTIQLPSKAEPGDHDAGIVAAIVTQRLASNGSKVSVEDRVGARVHIRVSGALHPQLLVRKLKTSYYSSLNPFGSGSATVTYEIANTGNIRFSATQELQLHSLLGGSAKTPKLAAIPELLPGNSILEQVKVSDVWPGLRLTATVVLVPAPSPQFPIPTLAPIRAHESSWAIPWMLLLLIALVAALAFLLIRRRRRKAAAAAAAAKRPARKRELVGAGAKAVAKTPVPKSVPAQAEEVDPIDLTDTPPMKVDLRNPFAGNQIDLSDEASPKSDSDPDAGSPSSSKPTGK